MQFVNETKTQATTFLMTGLALTIGLSWNEAIKSGIESYFPVDKGSDARAKFLYAIFLTLFMVFLTMTVIRAGIYKKPVPCVCADKSSVDKLEAKVNSLAGPV